MVREARPCGRAPGNDLAAVAPGQPSNPVLVRGFGFAQPRSPASSRFASRLPSTLRRRCFSPTSATNALHVHPWIGRFPSFAARAATDHPPPPSPSRPFRASRLTSGASGAGPPCDDPTPGERAFDGARPASALSRAAPSRSRRNASSRGRAPPTGRRPLATAFSAVSKIGERTSDAPFRAPLPTGRAGLPRGTRTASTAFASTNAVFPARDAFHRRMLQRARLRERSEPATGLADWPPAIRLPTLFHPHCSRVGG